jgi:GT2 family glycosyltransferase
VRPLTTIVVPVLNKLALTRECVTGLMEAFGAREDVEAVVVDDGSTDDTPGFVERTEGVRLVRHEETKGFAASCNDGAAAASGEHLVFLNNDTVGRDGWLDALVSYADAHSEAGIVGARLLYANGTVQHAGMVFGSDLLPRHLYRGFPADHPAVVKSRRLQAVTAACMLVRRPVFEEIGGFDTAFTNGFDDVDLCLSAGERNHETHYCHEGVLVHLEAATRGEDSELFERNASLYLERWGDRVRRDDLDFYAEDGLLELVPGDLYPLDLNVSPRLALVDQSAEVYELLGERSRQVFDLLKENAALRVRLGEQDPNALPHAGDQSADPAA